MKNTLWIATTAILAAFLVLPASAQITMTSTTLSSAIGVGDTTLVVASATGISARTMSINTMLYVDQELMSVDSVSGLRITVRRAASPTVGAAHNSGATVYLGPPSYYANNDPYGACVSATITVLPRIVPATRKLWQCIDSNWTEVSISAPTFRDATDGTKKVVVSVSGATTGTATTLTFAQSANRVITHQNATYTVVGRDTTDTLTNKTLTSAAVTTDIRATTAGSDAIGTALKPFGSLVLGSAATNAFTFTPAATAAGRAITIPDPGGAATLPWLNPTTTQTLSNTVVGTAASTASTAGLKLPTGTAPTTSVAGDVWHDSTKKTVAFAPVAAANVYAGGSYTTMTTPVTQADPSTIQDLGTFTLPAGALSAVGKTIRLCGGGTYTTAAGQTPTVTITWALAGVAPLAIVSAATTASATTIPWQGCATMTTITAGAAGTVEAGGHLAVTLGTAAAAAAAFYQGTNVAVSAAFDQTAAVIAKMRVTLSSANAANSVTQRWMTLEALN